MQEMSSSSMDNKNASEEIENKEQKSNKKSLRFGGWLPDVLDWYKRPELAKTSLPISSLTFHQHCYRRLHGKKVKPRIVRFLGFTREKDDAVNWQTILRKDYEIDDIPIADINPPDYIIGFEEISFSIGSSFIDDQLLQFMKTILPLLNDVKIYFKSRRYSIDPNPINRMMEVLAPKTNKLEIGPIFFNEFNKFNQHFPDFIPGLQSIYLRNVTTYTEMMEAADLALKWLTTPRGDGKPKMLEIRFISLHDDYTNMTKLIERVKEEFIRSTEPANFIIRCRLYNLHQGDHEDFEIQNEATKEMLELQRKGTYSFFLVRHKNDSETTTKVDWFEEQMKLESNTTNIRIWNLFHPHFDE